MSYSCSWHDSGTLLGDPVRRTQLAKVIYGSLSLTDCCCQPEMGGAGKSHPPHAAPGWRSVVAFPAASLQGHVLQALLASTSTANLQL